MIQPSFKVTIVLVLCAGACTERNEASQDAWQAQDDGKSAPGLDG